MLQQCDQSYSDLGEALAHLREAAKSPAKRPLSRRLRAAAIKQVPEVFQPRGLVLDEHHVQTLVRAIRSQGVLDPVLVIQLGESAYLIDGHHRLEAYGVAGFSDPVPVTHFAGTLEDAILEAGRTNSKAKLPMTNQERQNYAWRLVRMGDYYSRTQIRKAAAVADGQVSKMRQVRRQLGEEADGYPEWWRALQASKGRAGGEWTYDEREEWERDRATDLAEKLAKAWGPKPAEQTRVVAMALETYLGRRWDDFVDWVCPHNLEDGGDF